MTNDIWVLVANASRARLFSADPSRKDKEWKLVSELQHPESRAAGHELLADRPGTARQSGMGGAGLAPHNDPKEVEAKKFAHELSKTLSKAVDEHAFEKIVLVAPPHFLGLLRAELEHKVEKRVGASHGKDYHELNVRELAERIELA